MLLWYASIVGIPVGGLYTTRWMFRHMSLPSGTRVSFSGTVGQVYWWSFLIFVVSLFQPVGPSVIEALGGLDADAIAPIWSLVVLVLQGLIFRGFYEWTCKNVTVGSENPLSFTGGPWSCIGWTIVSAVSLVTLVGWAWVDTAFPRWQVRHTASTRHRLAFIGSGWGLLWRSLVALAASVTIVPIPWVVARMYKWAIENIEIQRLPEQTPELGSVSV